MTLKRWIPSGVVGNPVLATDDSANLSQILKAGAGSVGYVADTMDRGTVSARCYAPAAADTACIVMVNTAQPSGMLQTYFRINGALPTVQGHLLGTRNSSGNAAFARLQPNGTIIVYDSAGSNGVTVTPSPALVVGAAYYAELDVTPGSANNTGTGRLRVYDNNDTLVADSGALSAKNYGGATSANLTTARFGEPDTGIGDGYDVTFWGTAFNTNATVVDIPSVAKTVNAAPTGTITTPATAIQNETVGLRGTAADSDGTVASTLWSVVEFPAVLAAAPTVSNPTSLNSLASFVPLVAGDYKIRLAVTDNQGAVTNVDKIITVSIVTNAPDLIWNGSAWV